MRSSSSSKPVVAYKLNLHVFLLAPIEPILGLCGVPNGWCSRSASRLAISRWRRRNQTFKFQKFLPIKTRTLMARTQFIPLIYHRFPVSQTTRKLNHLFMTRIKKDSNRKSFFFCVVFQQMMNIIKWIWLCEKGFVCIYWFHQCVAEQNGNG